VRWAGGGGGDLPVAWVGQGAPGVYQLADFVDDGGGVVFDFGGGEALLVRHDHGGLLGRRCVATPAGGLGDRGDQLGATAAFDWRKVKRLALGV